MQSPTEGQPALQNGSTLTATGRSSAPTPPAQDFAQKLNPTQLSWAFILARYKCILASRGARRCFEPTPGVCTHPRRFVLVWNTGGRTGTALAWTLTAMRPRTAETGRCQRGKKSASKARPAWGTACCTGAQSHCAAADACREAAVARTHARATFSSIPGTSAAAAAISFTALPAAAVAAPAAAFDPTAPRARIQAAAAAPSPAPAATSAASRAAAARGPAYGISHDRRLVLSLWNKFCGGKPSLQVDTLFLLQVERSCVVRSWPSPALDGPEGRRGQHSGRSRGRCRRVYACVIPRTARRGCLEFWPGRVSWIRRGLSSQGGRTCSGPRAPSPRPRAARPARTGCSSRSVSSHKFPRRASSRWSRA